MATVFAPGVVKLFGEHAVVYGKPAIAAAIDKGVYVSCEMANELIVETFGAPSFVRYFPRQKRVETWGGERFFSYIDAALKIAEETWGPLDAKFVIKSDLPPSVGAATSAAVSIGFLKAYSSCAGADVEKIELAKLGHRVELEVQGVASPMDTTVSALGGVLKIWSTPFRVERLDVSLPFYIVFLPRIGTTKEIVAAVKAYVEKRQSLKWVLEAIGYVVEEGEGCLRRGDLVCVGELMYINNWLLGALGVVDRRVVELLEAVGPYIYGGKISGAGRGGVVLLLPRDEELLIKALSLLNLKFLNTSVYTRGVTEL
ncbi:MAG: mevalonate kinase [Pyrobaculum sp.]